jgi:hypothetical protein
LTLSAGCVAWLHHQWQAEREVILQVEQTGGQVYTVRNGPHWLRRLLGGRFGYLSERVYGVYIRRAHDADIAPLRRLRHLTQVTLPESYVTDAGLARLGEMKELRHLVLSHPSDPGRFTDAGIGHLKGLHHLEMLILTGTSVTDAGMIHLKDLRTLRRLDLEFANVGDAGLAHVRGLTGMEHLCLSHTRVTDAGLVNLSGLHRLRYLDLNNTAVSDAGLPQLSAKRGLRYLCLDHTRVTDAGVVHLARPDAFPALRDVNLSSTVSPAGKDRLSAAKPGLNIHIFKRGI